MELDALQKQLSEIRDLGAQLVAISPQTTESNAKAKQQWKLDYPVLSDHKNAWARQLGLVFTVPDDVREVYSGFGLDLPASNGEPSWELPMPARIVIDKEGIVRHIDADPDYTRRPEPDETIAALKAL